MKILYSLLLAVALAGCATSPKHSPPPAPIERAPVTGEVVSYRTIEEELRPFFPEEDPKIILMDPAYGCVSEEETRRIIAEALLVDLGKYIISAHDCENYAVEFSVIFQKLFRRDTANVPLGAPVGVIGGALLGDIPELGFVYPGYPCLHAMCAVRCRGGKWLLIEVQSKQVVEMTGPIYEGSFSPFLFIL